MKVLRHGFMLLLLLLAAALGAGAGADAVAADIAASAAAGRPPAVATAAADCPADAAAALAVAPPVSASGPTSMVMADGQLVSWNLRVFLPQPLPAAARPRLCLLSGHAVAAAAAGQQRPLRATVIAQGSQADRAPDGTAVMQSGTLVLFERRADLLQSWKPSMRVWPLLIWTGEDGQVRQLLGEREVTIGQAPVAWVLTGAALVGFVALLAAICRRGPSVIDLLTASDGHLSLSKLQMALWTLAVGGVVFYFALLRLDVPSVPESLVVLMGLSLATTGISYGSSAGAGAAVTGRPWRWADLVTVYDSTTDQPTELSLARAQMMFWTLLLLIVFIAKTVLGGVLWDIPWSLVALMGISQAGYLAPKVVPSFVAGAATAAAPTPPPAQDAPRQP